MSDTKWTPGPWEAVEVKPCVYHIMPVDRSPRRVPIAVKDGSRESHPETRHVTHPAEAHLIAESPSLYERLRVSTRVMEATSEFLSDHERQAVLDEIEQNESVLAKARGQS